EVNETVQFLRVRQQGGVLLRVPPQILAHLLLVIAEVENLMLSAPRILLKPRHRFCCDSLCGFPREENEEREFISLYPHLQPQVNVLWLFATPGPKQFRENG